MHIGGRNLYLPSADLGAFDPGADKNTAVTIGLKFEFQGENKILVMLVGTEIAVLLIRSAFANQLAVVDIPFLCTVNIPSGKIFSVEEGLFLLRESCSHEETECQQ